MKNHCNAAGLGPFNRFPSPTEQFGPFNSKRVGEFENLKIGNPPGLGFNFGKSVPAQIPASHVQFCNELHLGEIFLHAQITHDRTNDISWRLHLLTMADCVQSFVLNSAQCRILKTKGKIMFIRRLGQSGQQQCSTGLSCPQILEMQNGDFAVVGADMTEEAIPAMPPGPGVGPNERVIRVPRQVLIAARTEIPAA
jgi:hypothetical protein